jgi:hypothetical protein
MHDIFHHMVPEDSGMRCDIVWASDFMKWLAGIWSYRQRHIEDDFLKRILDNCGGVESAMFGTCAHRTLYNNLKAGHMYTAIA